MTLIVEGEKLPAHKFVLGAKSKVFEAMLYGDLMESGKKEIHIKEAPITAFKLLLKSLYCEEFHLNEADDYETAMQVYELADQYQLYRLMQTIKHMLEGNF